MHLRPPALPTLFAVLLLCAPPLFGLDGLRIEQDVTTPNQDAVRQVIHLVPGRMRSETPGQTMILRQDTRDLLFLQADERRALRMPLDRLASLVGAGGLLGGGTPEARPTGRTRRIGPWQTRELVLNQDLAGVGSLRIEAWVTEEVEVPKPTEGDASGALADVLGIVSGVRTPLPAGGGVPVESKTTISVMGTSWTSTQRVVEMEQRELPEELFEVPAGWTIEEATLEEMGGGMLGGLGGLEGLLGR